MASLCLFASHYAGQVLPEYIRVYLGELSKKFDRTILLCEQEPDEPSAGFLGSCNIEHRIVRNEGYDFGKWFRAFQEVDASSFETVAMVNDSCVLFRSLDPFFSWLRDGKSEVAGMTKSYFRGEHIQSYFLVLRGRAVAIAQEHFNATGIVQEYDEVITRYELAMNARFLEAGLSLAGFVDNAGYQGEFSPYYKCVEYHLKQGMPLIKKRILMGDYRNAELFTMARMNFRISPLYYATVIAKHASPLIFDPFRMAKNHKLTFLRRARYELTRLIVNTGRPLKRLFFSGK